MNTLAKERPVVAFNCHGVVELCLGMVSNRAVYGCVPKKGLQVLSYRAEKKNVQL